MADARAEIGIFGGSGFYAFLDQVTEVKVDTPYGAPSDRIALAELSGKRVAFLPRHGKGHEIPPHKINYRANLWALRSLGVTRVLSPCAAGSLSPAVKPGDFVVVDQFVDRTRGRVDTYYDGPIVTHVSCAEPFCPELRSLAVSVTRSLGINCHDRGTSVVISGPRFSSVAESRWFSKAGWEVINMTLYPEVVLARELELCYASIALITDYDAGLEGDPSVPHVRTRDVLGVLKSNTERVKAMLHGLVGQVPTARGCECGSALKFARLD